MLEFQQINLELHHRMLWFESKDGRIDSHGLWQITGPNGSGKSTLMKLLCGLIRPTTGLCTWNGRSIHVCDFYLKNVAYLSHRMGLISDFNWLDHARVWKKTLELDLPMVPVRQLSEGQKQQLAFALFDQNKPLWFLDEPTTSLDQKHRDHIFHAIERHIQRGGLCVLIDHSRQYTNHLLSLA